FCVNVRTQLFEQSFDIRFGEEHNVIHRPERGNDLGASIFIENRAACSLEVAYAGIGIHTDNEDVAYAASAFQITNVADVERIKTAVGEDDLLTLAPVFGDFRAQHVPSNDFGSSFAHALRGGSGRLATDSIK